MDSTRFIEHGLAAHGRCGVHWRRRFLGNVLSLFDGLVVQFRALGCSGCTVPAFSGRLGIQRHAIRRSRGNVLLIRQRPGVHVHHHLVAVARRSPVQPARQRAFRQQPDRIRPPVRERRYQLLLDRRHVLCQLFGRCILRFVRRRVTPRPHLVARRLQRPPQHRPHLRRQPPLDNHHPVVVHPRPQRPLLLSPPLLRLLRHAIDPPPPADDLLYMRGRAAFRHVEQRLLVLRCGDARHGAHLRVGDDAAPHRVAQLRQVRQRTRHPDVLARRARSQARAPAQPMRARGTARPAGTRVELPDQEEQLVGGGLNACGELGDAVAEAFELGPAIEVRHRPGIVRRGHDRVYRGGEDGSRDIGCRHESGVLNRHTPS